MYEALYLKLLPFMRGHSSFLRCDLTFNRVADEKITDFNKTKQGIGIIDSQQRTQAL